MDTTTSKRIIPVKRRYVLSMMSLLPLTLVFDVIYFTQLGSAPYLVFQLLIHLLVFGPLNLAGTLWLYRPIGRFYRDAVAETKAKKRIETITRSSTILVFCLGILYQILFFSLSPMVPQEGSSFAISEIPVQLFLTFIPSLLYFSGILPAFIAYFVVNDFTLYQKEDAHRRFGFAFATGQRRIGSTLLAAFVILGFIPSFLVLLSLTAVAEMAKEFARFTTMNPLRSAFPDRFVEIVGMVFAVVFITRSFTHPIHSLLARINRVKESDYTTEAPVITGDEIGLLTAEFNLMVKGLREREMIRDSFGKYVTKDIVKIILEKKINLEGELRPATILVTDIANYTTISEPLQPRETVRMLNEYFTALVGIIHAHQGVVNKFIGDSIFAFFNVPLDDKDHAVHAIQAAQEIEALTKVRLFGSQSGASTLLSTRIGINSGLVLAGNLGSSDRAEYTVIGDEVNVASRLETLNKEYGTSILLGENTYQLAKDHFSFTKLGELQLKGKKNLIPVYRLADQV